MQISTLQQYDGGNDHSNQFGFELQNVAQTPKRGGPQKKLSVALLQTKRKISALTSMTQIQKKIESSSTLKSPSIGGSSFSSSVISEDQFYDVQSNFGINDDNLSYVGSQHRKNRHTITSRKEQNQKQGSDQENNDEESNHRSSDSDQSFYSMDGNNSPDIGYERTKVDFYHHIKFNSKTGLTSPNLQKLPQSTPNHKVTVQEILSNEKILKSTSIENSIIRENRLQSIEKDDRRQRRRSSSLGSLGDTQKYNIMDIVGMVSPTHEQQEKSDELFQIEEETHTSFSSAMQSRDFSKNFSKDESSMGQDFKKYMNLTFQRSSCINQFNQKNITTRTTNDTLDTTTRLDISFLRDDDTYGFESSGIRKPKMGGKLNYKLPDKRAASNILDCRNSLQCMTTVSKTFENEMKQKKMNILNKATNYYRQRKDVQQLFSFNRVLEIKRKYQSKNQVEKAMKSFTNNLTFILSCEILKSKVALRLFQFLLVWSAFMRLYFYFFSLYIILADPSYSYYMVPMIFLPRIFYTLSMFQVIFSYQNHTKSYRQVSQIFNSAFGNDDYFQIMNMNQLLTSDSFEKLSREKIIARFKFILCPPEVNLLSLDSKSVSFSKRKDVWYLSNYIMLSIEYISVYIIMIFFSIYNHQFTKEFQLDEKFTFNVYTFSFIYYTSSVIAFIIYSLYYLRKGNLRLRRENLNQTKKQFS